MRQEAALTLTNGKKFKLSAYINDATLARDLSVAHSAIVKLQTTFRAIMCAVSDEVEKLIADRRIVLSDIKSLEISKHDDLIEDPHAHKCPVDSDPLVSWQLGELRKTAQKAQQKNARKNCR